MPKYKCELCTTTYYEFDVEADSKAEALAIAKQEWHTYMPVEAESYEDSCITEIIENKATLGDYSQESGEDLPF